MIADRFRNRLTASGFRWLCQGGAALIVAVAAGAAAGEQAAENPGGRIYTSIFFRKDNTFVREAVAVDPQTGACETIANNGIDPRISPDGLSVAYWTMLQSNNPQQADGEVWVKKLSAEAEPQKVWAGDGAPHACWTRDGKHLIVTAAVRSEDNKRWRHSTSLVDPVSSEAQAIDLPDTEDVLDCAHHSDLRLMSTSLGGLSLYSMLPDKTQRTMITRMKQSDYRGRFSSDDKRVLFMRREGRTMKVCTADLDGKNVQVAFTEKELTNPEHVGWSPDGKRVAVAMFDWQLENGKKIMRAGENANYRIAIMDTDGGNYRELTLDRAVTEIDGIEWR